MSEKVPGESLVATPILVPLPDRRKVGRPRKPHTMVINVRIPDHVYDAYCKAALRVDEDVRKVMRTVLSYYAPKG